MRCFVEGIGVLAPGLRGWVEGRPVLAGRAPYTGGEVTLPRPDMLPLAERRRTGASTQLALAVGQEALGRSGHAEPLATVFTSSGADGEVVHHICETLAASPREVSPTRFHNSVHNAPAGYWGIGTGCREPSTSLCGYDWSFAAGLLYACAQVSTDTRPVLLISYDVPYPEPLYSARPLAGPFGAALLLGAAQSACAIAALDVTTAGSAPATLMGQPALEALRVANPSGRSLPLLAAIAASHATRVTLDYLGDGALNIDVQPC